MSANIGDVLIPGETFTEFTSINQKLVLGNGIR